MDAEAAEPACDVDEAGVVCGGALSAEAAGAGEGAAAWAGVLRATPSSAKKTAATTIISSQRRGDAHRSNSLLSLLPSTIDNTRKTLGQRPGSVHTMAINHRLVKFRTDVMVNPQGI
jgi:hypothetical protein